MTIKDWYIIPIQFYAQWQKNYLIFRYIVVFLFIFYQKFAFYCFLDSPTHTWDNIHVYDFISDEEIVAESQQSEHESVYVDLLSTTNMQNNSPATRLSPNVSRTHRPRFLFFSSDVSPEIELQMPQQPLISSNLHQPEEQNG